MLTLFVYGSLKRGLSNHHWMGDAPFLGAAVTQPNYRIYDYGGFPALVEVEAGTGVSLRGELFSVSEADMRRLDILEGVEDDLYGRGEVALASPRDQDTAITYLYLRSVQGMPDAGEEWLESIVD